MLGGKYYDIENPYKVQDDASVICKPTNISGKHRWSLLRILILLVVLVAFAAVFIGTMRYGYHSQPAVQTGNDIHDILYLFHILTRLDFHSLGSGSGSKRSESLREDFDIKKAFDRQFPHSREARWRDAQNSPQVKVEELISRINDGFKHVPWGRKEGSEERTDSSHDTKGHDVEDVLSEQVRELSWRLG